MLNGESREGYSSGQAIKAIQQLAAEKLPQGYDFDWAGSTRDQANSGNENIMIFLICLTFVYLILSAQYESFILPFTIILSLPFGVFGAFLFLQLFQLENNIYAQLALIMLIGLLGKNAVLIVEFAMQKSAENIPPLKAAMLGATIRLRPILMTSFAFIAGLIPLMLANGAGAIGNKTIGSAAAGGMLIGTLFGIFIVPGLYYIMASISTHFQKTIVMYSYKLKLICICCIMMVISSCKSRFNFDNNKVSIPNSYGQTKDTLNSSSLKWNQFFKDDNLIALIETGLQNNHDLLEASQNIEIAKNRFKIQESKLFPMFSVQSTASKTKYGTFTAEGAGNKSTDIEPNQVIPNPLTDYNIGFILVGK